VGESSSEDDSSSSSSSSSSGESASDSGLKGEPDGCGSRGKRKRRYRGRRHHHNHPSNPEDQHDGDDETTQFESENAPTSKGKKTSPNAYEKVPKPSKTGAERGK
jgi:protein phosphatase 1 regulatory subunit 11